jgi:hypothetical protein
MKQVPSNHGGKKMKNYLGLALVFAALGFFSIGQAFATGPKVGIDSTCPDGTYPITCGPVTVTVTSENGFSGTVTLSTSVDPVCGTDCLTATMNPASVYVPPGGSATSKLSLSYTCHTSLYHPHCEWVVTITATSSAPSNSTGVFVCIGRNCPI